MKITTGLEVGEDIFPLQSGKLFFDGPDKDREKIFNSLKKELSESFPTRDVTSSINFDRLLGELTRSIILSPSKWANRVFYPKLFDRVFCMLIDESDFSTDESGQTTESGYSLEYVLDVSDGTLDYSSMSSQSNAHVTSENDPTYYQFYASISILEPMNDSLSSSEQNLESESSLSSNAIARNVSVTSANVSVTSNIISSIT